MAGAAAGAGAGRSTNLPSGLKDCPTWQREKMSFEDWRTDVDFWIDAVSSSGVTSSVIAGSIYFGLDEEGKKTMRQMTATGGADPVQIFQKLDGIYKKEAGEEGYAAYVDHRDFGRKQGPKIDKVFAYMETTERRLVTKTLEGTELPDPLRAYRLLDAAPLSSQHRRSAMTNSKLSNQVTTGHHKVSCDTMREAILGLANPDDLIQKTGRTWKTVMFGVPY